MWEAQTKKAPAWEPIEAVIDDEDNPLWDKYSVNIVPTVLFFDQGKVVKRLDGKGGVGLKAADRAKVLAPGAMGAMARVRHRDYISRRVGIKNSE